MKVKQQIQARKGFSKPYDFRYQHLKGVLIYRFRKKILELYFLTQDEINNLKYKCLSKRIKMNKK
jgi:hypothetical protein